MARALYDPDHGYYGAGKARVGRGGDFFTNVSVGPLFGRLLARQFVEMWQRLGKPADFVLVEQGAHHGDCAADVLAALREFDPACFDATTLWLVEPLRDLRQAQARKAPRISRRPKSAGPTRSVTSRHFTESTIPTNSSTPSPSIASPGAVIAGWSVASTFKATASSSSTARSPRRPCALISRACPLVPTDYETEVNLDVVRWLAEVASKLRAGFVLAIDYGYVRGEYYRPERASGTLSAYAAHRRVSDPLERPGEIDLTAHVDFTSLAEAATPLGLQLAGFTDQHHFMVGLSRLHFPDDRTLTAAGQQELRAFKTLMHPGLMGQSFHALCLAKDVGDTPSPASNSPATPNANSSANRPLQRRSWTPTD